MKKLMYIAAALLVLVGCNNKENVIENAPQNLVTITGGIDFSAQDGPNKIVAKPGWEDVTSGNKVGFIWEEGDKIAVVDNEMTEIKQFTIKSISENKQTATFTGEPLSIGMESYSVLYPYEYGEVVFNKESKKSFFANQQYSGKLRPCIMGFSEEDGTFTMDFFWDVMDLSLTGSDKLGKIVYHIDKDDEDQPYDVTLSFGNGGLQLTEQPQHVTFIPCALDKNGFKLSFYDTNNQLIMEKKSEKNITTVGGIISFPTLEVKADPYNGHEYVDLGLPSGLKWATMNVGATKPEGYGDYFAWGETSPKTYYRWSSYKYIQDGKSTWGFITKYTFPDNQTGVLWYNGKTFVGDNKTTLDPEDDAAIANWKGAWRMPTEAEFEELIKPENCKWERIENYNDTGVNGLLVTSKTNGNSIFFPASGHYYGSSLDKDYLNAVGCYLSSSIGHLYSYESGILVFNDGRTQVEGGARYYGSSVRAVCDVQD